MPGQRSSKVSAKPSTTAKTRPFAGPGILPTVLSLGYKATYAGSPGTTCRAQLAAD
jgi:hypothetical protein